MGGSNPGARHPIHFYRGKVKEGVLRWWVCLRLAHLSGGIRLKCYRTTGVSKERHLTRGRLSGRLRACGMLSISLWTWHHSPV